MPTIIHIHGGEARDNDSEFIQFLHDLPLDLSHEKTKKRSRKYDEIFPNTKSYRPEMPCAFNAKYTQRKIRFEKYLEQISDELILIGHSLGANFLAKRLAENHIKQYSCTIQQLHLVAGCYGRAGGFDLTDNFPGYLPKQVKEIHIYHSSDDDLVPITDAEKYHQKIPGSIFHKFTDRNHFLQPEFPELRKNIK